ncbi:hypothetical protein [Pacificibacter sp. AS14]|uniref:oxidoreductase n=1 Tax=Pacificibacter sp. AS14 TaxID=3135785 RepID=UPI00316CE698
MLHRKKSRLAFDALHSFQIFRKKLPPSSAKRKTIRRSESFSAFITKGFGQSDKGANGYLLDQFLTDYSNQRTDTYGNDVTNQLRLTCEVIECARHAVGRDYIHTTGFKANAPAFGAGNCRKDDIRR